MCEPGERELASGYRTNRSRLLLARFRLCQWLQFLKQREHFDRQRKDDGGVLLHSDFSKRLQVAQLNGDRLRCQQRRGVHQL